jgi:hypothetical protein
MLSLAESLMRSHSAGARPVAARLYLRAFEQFASKDLMCVT